MIGKWGGNITYKEKLLRHFPKARLVTYSDGSPSICVVELGLLEHCPYDISCEACWSLTMKDDEPPDEKAMRLLIMQHETTIKFLWEEIATRDEIIKRMREERGQIENVD